MTLTEKLAKLYRSKGKEKLAKAVEEFSESVKNLRDSVNRMEERYWFDKQIECSTCHKYYSDVDEKGFILENGMCIGCDHVKGEVDSRIQYEADSVRDEFNEEDR